MYLTVDCVPEFEPLLDLPYLESLAAAVLAGEGIGGESELSLTVTDDQGIRTINRIYRGFDTATDVLSFSLAKPGDAFVQPPDGITHLGDVVISHERAAVQAQELGHSLRQEMAELFVHGLLHILGYDHESEDDALLMAGKAELYLAA